MNDLTHDKSTLCSKSLEFVSRPIRIHQYLNSAFNNRTDYISYGEEMKERILWKLNKLLP